MIYIVLVVGSSPNRFLFVYSCGAAFWRDRSFALVRRVPSGHHEARWMLTVAFTELQQCLYCKGTKGLLKTCGNDTTITHEASIWVGSEWTTVKHGTKRCTTCRRNYKLSYVSERGTKTNTVRATENNPTILLYPELGFSYNYLKQFWNRACRCAVSAQGETATILMTFPDIKFGSQGKSTAKGGDGRLSEVKLARKLAQALFIFLRLQEECYAFDIDDPVPDHDPKYGRKNEGLYTIFDVAKDDPGFTGASKKFDVVTDGNYQSRRKLCRDEKRFTKNMTGRPPKSAKSKKQQTVPKSNSRCAAVRNKENIKLARTRTGGLFATVNMKTKDGLKMKSCMLQKC